MDLGLRGKRVLVSGSTRGIGLAIAELFAQEGASVAVTSRHGRDATDVASTLDKSFQGDHYGFECDFTCESDVDSLSKALQDRWTSLDILVVNVGSGVSVPDPVPGPEQFDSTMNLNFRSAYLTAHKFFPSLVQSQGCLLFISSIAGIEAIGAPVDYASAKAALLAFAKNMARKAAAQNVRVNCVAPGNVLFEGGSWAEKARADPGRVARLIDSTVPMKRFGTPIEIAQSCVFMCSAAAKFITGSVLVVDGGQTHTII